MDKSEVKKRLDICSSCPHREPKFLAPAQCGLCGCVLKVKASMSGEKCPIEKW